MLRRTLLTALGLAALGACQPNVVGFSRTLGREAEEREPVFERRRTWFDAEHAHLRSETEYLVQHDGIAEKHGRERRWYPDGTPQLEREFRHGEPSGQWRAWFASGQLRSESFHDPSTEPHPARWWYEDGTPSTEGQTRDGVRTGTWRTFHPNGVLESEGPYVQGKLQGTWTYWDADGALVQRGEYREGERVGTWEFGPGFSSAPRPPPSPETSEPPQ